MQRAGGQNADLFLIEEKVIDKPAGQAGHRQHKRPFDDLFHPNTQVQQIEDMVTKGCKVLLINGGNIDLAVGSVIAFIGAVNGVLILNMHMNAALAIVISLVIGFLIGLWQGSWVAYARIPGFIVTLAGMLIFRGLTLSILNGKTIGPFPDSFQAISAGFIHDPLKSVSPRLNILTILIGLTVSVCYRPANGTGGPRATWTPCRFIFL